MDMGGVDQIILHHVLVFDKSNLTIVIIFTWNVTISCIHEQYFGLV